MAAAETLAYDRVMKGDAPNYFRLRHTSGDPNNDFTFFCEVITEHDGEFVDIKIQSGQEPPNFLDEVRRSDRYELKTRTFGVLQLHLANLRSRVEGLRPRDEITAYLQDTEASLIRQNPLLDYRELTALYRNG